MWRRLRELRDDDESGSVLLLILGFGIVVLALAFVVASISALHIERKQLLAAADAAALDAASLLDEERFLAENAQDFLISPDQVTARVEDYLASFGPAIGLDDPRVVAASVGEDGRTVTLTLSGRADLPLVPAIIPGIADALRVEVTSVARGF